MKKIYLFFALIVAASTMNAQCTINAGQQTTPGISPSPSHLPCVVDSAPFDQTIQVQCPTTFDTIANLVLTTVPLTFTVDSIELDSVINIPIGLTWSRNPARLPGGQNGCLEFTGTTTAAPGVYHLTWYGTAWVTPQAGGGAIPGGAGQRMVTGSLNKYGFVDYYLTVIANSGSSCPTTGISTIDPTLNAELSVYPNPSNGVFAVKLNAGSRVSGVLNVLDVTGRTVFAQDVDLIGTQNVGVDLGHCAKGIYTVLLHTANGNAAKTISID